MNRFLLLAFVLTVLVPFACLAAAEDADEPDLAATRTRIYDTINLLGTSELKEEIKLSDEQAGKIEQVLQETNAAQREIAQSLLDGAIEDHQKKLAEIAAQTSEAIEKIEKLLKPEQMTRIEQIAIQREGLNALSNPEIAKTLKLTERQSRKIAAVRAEGTQKRQQLIQDTRAGKSDRGQLDEKMKEIHKQTEKKAMEQLTMEQQTWFEQMQGEKFDFRRVGLTQAFLIELLINRSGGGGPTGIPRGGRLPGGAGGGRGGGSGPRQVPPGPSLQPARTMPSSARRLRPHRSNPPGSTG